MFGEEKSVGSAVEDIPPTKSQGWTTLKVGNKLPTSSQKNRIYKTDSQSPTQMPKKIVDEYGDDPDTRLRKYMENAPARPHTLEEIGDIMGITRERVRQVEAQALRKLRNRLWKILKSDGYDEEELKR